MQYNSRKQQYFYSTVINRSISKRVRSLSRYMTTRQTHVRRGIRIFPINPHYVSSTGWWKYKKKKKFQIDISVSIAETNADQIESEERFVCSQIRTKRRNKRKNCIWT